MQAFMVTRGAYDEYTVLHVFADPTTAHQWVDGYKAAVPWTNEDDQARVEPVGFTPVGHRPPVPGREPLGIDADPDERSDAAATVPAIRPALVRRRVAHRVDFADGESIDHG